MDLWEFWSKSGLPPMELNSSRGLDKQNMNTNINYGVCHPFASFQTANRDVLFYLQKGSSRMAQPTEVIVQHKGE